MLSELAVNTLVDQTGLTGSQIQTAYDLMMAKAESNVIAMMVKIPPYKLAHVLGLLSRQMKQDSL